MIQEIRMSKLEQMIEAQETLNTLTNGEGWRTGVTDTGKFINWTRCIRMEICELIDSTPWKHWKDINGKTDINNMKIELVDIWHFIMADMLMKYNSTYICKSINDNINLFELFKKKGLDNTLLIDLQPFEDLLHYTFTEDRDIVTYINKFAECMHVINMTFDELYDTYIAKYALNRFRYSNGYQTGEYMKLWNGVEDNVVLMEVVKYLKDEKKELGVDIIYSHLTARYYKLRSK